MVRKHGIPLPREKTWTVFLQRRFQKNNRMLLHECEAAGVQIRLRTGVRTVEKNSRFEVETEMGRSSQSRW